MSLTIECLECGHTGRVSPAKAGMTIPCPSCGESIEVSGKKATAAAGARGAGAKASRGSASKAPRRSAAATRRPKADNSIGLIALLGSTVLLAGILVMYWIKKNQLDEDFNFSQSPDATEPNADDGASNSGDDPADSDLPDVDGLNPANLTAESGATEAGSSDQQTDSMAVNTAGQDPAADIILPEVQAVSPQVALMADITEVVFQVNSLPEDKRGAVQNAIESYCTSELNKCRLDCVEGDEKPKLVVDLDLRNIGGIQKLGMKAQLQAEMLGLQVVVWEHDAALVPIDQKALSSGISLPGLDREVAYFFVSLRDKISSSKTAINSIKEINRRKKAAEQDEILNTEG